MRTRWAHAALTTLMWAAVPMWASCTGFYIWSLYDGPPECGTSMAYTAVLAFTGTMVFVIRHNSPGARLLLAALRASLRDDEPKNLRAVPDLPVPPQATGSCAASRSRSAH